MTPRHARWSLLLSEYDFSIEHISGTKNAAADALSRRPDLVPQEEESRARLERVLLNTIVIDDKDEIIYIDDANYNTKYQSNRLTTKNYVMRPYIYQPLRRICIGYRLMESYHHLSSCRERQFSTACLIPVWTKSHTSCSVDSSSKTMR